VVAAWPHKHRSRSRSDLFDPAKSSHAHEVSHEVAWASVEVKAIDWSLPFKVFCVILY